MKSLIFTILAVALMFAVNVQAFTVTLSGVDVTVEYTEPTTNADSSPLTDLSRTEITNSFNLDVVNVPATVATGGGVINQVVSIPVVDGQEADVVIQVFACDGSDNCSTPATATVRIDRLAPAPVQ